MDDVLVPRRRLLTRHAAREPKIISLVLVVSMLAVSIAGLESHGTISYFTDAEQSLGNNFVADPIFFSVTASTTAQTFDGAEASSTTPIVLTTVPGEGSDLVQYYVTAEKTDGSDTFCNALTATGDAPLSYNGSLLSLHTSATNVMGPLNLFVSLPDATGVSSGDTCAVDLIYKGWNDGVEEGSGYTDTHRVSLVFTYEEVPIILPLTEAGAIQDLGGVVTGGSGSVDPQPAATTTDATTTDAVAPPADIPPDVPPPAESTTTPPADETVVPPPVPTVDTTVVDTPPVADTPPADIPPTDTPPPPPDVPAQ
jgi:hypothetical protein